MTAQYGLMLCHGICEVKMHGICFQANTPPTQSEEEYDALDRKRRTIENDRIAIERVISGLDKKKNEALESAYIKVNGDFGSIFSTLLPGARAELKPVEGGTVLDGLE
jgi:structural maintenance of chromosome 2